MELIIEPSHDFSPSGICDYTTSDGDCGSYKGDGKCQSYCGPYKD